MNTLMTLVLFSFAAVLAAPAAAAEQAASHDGIVVSASQGKLSMKDEAGREHSHDVGESVTITVNGKPGKLEDLKAGMKIRVMTDENHAVLSISTIDSEKS